ncbi:MAG: glycogen debranching enzyme N-terminal domain-containing protein, partial [Gemmatimonadaceae bacterium]
MDDAELHRPAWVAGRPIGAEQLIEHEWLVTNGLGGYASGTIGGVMTRKYHGYLIASLPAPLGRLVMLQNLHASLLLPDGREVALSGEERLPERLDVPAERTLTDFRLELGLPVWEYDVDGVRLLKRVLMPHGQNTVHVAYRLLGRAPTGCRLRLRPFVHFRSYEAAVTTPQLVPHCVVHDDSRVELRSRTLLPELRMTCGEPDARFTADEQNVSEVVYRLERDRGYEWRGVVWSPGFFELPLPGDAERALAASTEPWEVLDAEPPHEALRVEQTRRRDLLQRAGPLGRDRVTARLTLAADAFIIEPAGRREDEARARAAGDEARTIIAGYHWFTDWGRDTMISLEGLTLCTGRHREAGYIIRTFAHHVRDGLIPNMFPDGASEGLYHTADATLWFFHAVHRFVQATGNRTTLRAMLPRLRDIVDRHIAGTRFGIGVDPADGLLVQGAEGYQLTWMDAKVDDWVVTPRR